MMSGDATLSALWTACLVHLWQTTLILAPVFILGRLARPAPGRLLDLMWWVALAKLLVPLAVLDDLVV
jgi:hypothetical protein